MTLDWNHRLERAGRIYGIIATLLFFGSGVFYLILGRWPITHQDFWVIYDTCLHQSWLRSSILKYNGHSCFFPVQLWLTDLRFFHGTQDFLFATGLIFESVGTALFIIPIWSDKTIGSTSRTAAILTLIVGNFWMGRASMTASGGFNTAYSLVLLGAATVFFYLPTVARNAGREAKLLAIVILCNVLASFSFGTGLACWGATLITGYCLRFRLRILVAIASAAALSGVIYISLPPYDASASLAQGLDFGRPSTYLALLQYLCRLLGAPLLHFGVGWSGSKGQTEEAFSSLALWGGAIAVFFSMAVMVRKLARRDLRSGLEATGFALMTFNFIAFALITLARASHIAKIPAELNAPRYLYWSSLFWTGLILVAIRQGEDYRWLRWPVVVGALAIPILAFPSHYQEARHFRYVRLLAREAATSLVAGIHDENRISVLSPYPDLVYRLCKTMKADRLDMFAPPYAQWIGRKSSAIFVERRRTAHFRGHCHSESAGNGIRIHGSARSAGGTPEVMVILDRHDVIRGIARSSATAKWVNRYLYGQMFSTHSFVGFVTPGGPPLPGTIRSVQGESLSSETIAVPAVSKAVPGP